MKKLILALAILTASTAALADSYTEAKRAADIAADARQDVAVQLGIYTDVNTSFRSGTKCTVNVFVEYGYLSHAEVVSGDKGFCEKVTADINAIKQVNVVGKGAFQETYIVEHDEEGIAAEAAEDANAPTFRKNKMAAEDFQKQNPNLKWGPVVALKGTAEKPVTYTCNAIKMARIDYDNSAPVSIERAGVIFINKGNTQEITFKKGNVKMVADGEGDGAIIGTMENGFIFLTTAPSQWADSYILDSCVAQ